MNNRQRGAALLIVLMLLAIMAALAAEMTLRFQTQYHRTAMINRHFQRQYDRQLAEDIALNTLLNDMQDNRQQTAAHQYWAQPQTLRLKKTNTVLAWQLHDAQRCFNLNALSQTPTEPLAPHPYAVLIFSALLKGFGVDAAKSDALAQSIADYIDSDNTPRLHGAEDEFYLSRKPAQRSAGQSLSLISELRHIKGMTEPLYRQLLPWLCVLPDTKLTININAMTERDVPLMRAMFLNDITDTDAQALLNKRPDEGWQTPDAFLYWAQKNSTAVKPLASRLRPLLTTASHFFLLEVTSKNEGTAQRWRARIYYDRRQHAAWIYQRSLMLNRQQ